MFDESSMSGRFWHFGIHCVGAQSAAVTFLVNDIVYPPATLNERTGAQLFAQLADGVNTVVEGIRAQLVLQDAVKFFLRIF